MKPSRKLLQALILVILVSSPLYALSISGTSKLPYVPHEDPAAVKEALDAYSLLMYYGDVVSLISVKSYGDAAWLIERLKYLHLPEELRYVVGRYNQLSLELTNALEDADKALEEASSLLSQYRLEEASEKLRETSVLLGRAELLLEDLDDSLGILSSRIGVYAFPPVTRIAEAYNRLQEALRKLRELTQEYVRLLAGAKREASTIEKVRLEPTQVALSLNATSAFVGDSIEARGSLTSRGSPLPGRTMALFLDGEAAATVTSKPDGSFEAILRIPFRYIRSMGVRAVYTPLRTDLGVYTACESAPVTLDIIFYETGLEVRAPEKAYPGLPFTVSVQMTPQGFASRGRRVRLLLDDVTLAHGETGAGGFLDAELLVDPSMTTRRHTLLVTVEPQGLHAGASQSLSLSVGRLTPDVKVRVPAFVILPTTVSVKGGVTSTMGPLAHANIRLELGGVSATSKTSDRGEFNATLEMALSLILVGFHELKVAVQPSEPWHEAAQVKASVFILNPGNLALALTATLFIGATLIAPSVRGRTEQRRAIALTEPFEPLPRQERPMAGRPAKPSIWPGGAMGKILQAYLRASRLVEAASLISMEPNMTLREFLARASPKLGGAAQLFEELTMLTEAALYAPYTPGEEEASKAEGLASALEGRLLKLGNA